MKNEEWRRIKKNSMNGRRRRVNNE